MGWKVRNVRMVNCEVNIDGDDLKLWYYDLILVLNNDWIMKSLKIDGIKCALYINAICDTVIVVYIIIWLRQAAYM